MTLAPTPPEPQHKEIRFRPAAGAGVAAAAQQYLALIDGELERYPKRLLRVTGIRNIALVQQLTSEGRLEPFVLDPFSGTMYANILGDERDEWYLRCRVNWTLGFWIDWRLKGFLQRDDPRWAMLNEPGFKYAPQHNIVANVRKDHSDATPGFFSLYSKGSAIGDKVTVFAGLMMPDDTQLLEKQAARDRVLKAKADHMREIIEYFSKALILSLDENNLDLKQTGRGGGSAPAAARGGEPGRWR